MKQGEYDEIKRELRWILTQIHHLAIREDALEERLQDLVQSKPLLHRANLMRSSVLDVCAIITSSMLLFIVTLYFEITDNIDKFLASELT